MTEYRWADGQYDRLPELAADLVRRKVAVIAAISGTPAVLAAKAATSTIPIVFAVGADPVAFGLVGNFSRPGGNVTGVTFLIASLGEKRLELLRELIPNARAIAVLTNPTNPVSAAEAKNVRAAIRASGQQVTVMDVTTGGEIDAAFATLARERPDALFIAADPLFLNERKRLAALAARYRFPAMYADHEIVETGGLISYGPNRTDAYRVAGVYVGRILKGEKPGDLPVQQSTKLELVLNRNTATALQLAVPPALLARADEVIE